MNLKNCLILSLFIFFPFNYSKAAPIIIDHNHRTITSIPEAQIVAAKNNLHIAYGHTSHGSQLTYGMNGLVAFMNAKGATNNLYAWNNGGTNGALDLHDGAMAGDVGYFPQWVDNTRAYLGAPDATTGRGTGANADVNVIIWSWCGQASGLTEAQMITNYLEPMSTLEEDYPGIKFVYMTGHLDGGGLTGNLHLRNEQIREYCRNNDKILYDFADIESYDPDGVYYGDKIPNDNCDYDSDGNGSRDRNWAIEWQNSHTLNVDWYDCGAAHSQSLNANLKAYAAWWLWARLAGWEGEVSSGTIEASASRAQGVAPLSVHFNADLIASSETERSFHDLEYSWDFGDTNAGNWGTNGKPKNEDKGPVAAHVYETAGTFTATLTVRDATGIVDTKTFEITVEDPDTFFAGTKTTCISTDADFTNCPAGAAQVITADLSGLAQYADAGERILFRRGDAWNVATQIPFPNNQGPVSIGAFGVCSNPDELGICENAPLITIDTTLGQNGHSFLNQTNKSDWRLADISFVATMGNGYVTSGVTGVKNHLAYKIKADGFFTPFYTTHWRHNDTDYFDNNAYVSSRLTGSSLWLIYTGSERLSVMGNIVKNSDQSHVVRLWQSYKAVVSHNNISGAGLNYPGSGRQALKLFGPATSNDSGVPDRVGTFAETGNGGLRNRTEFVVIANNVIGGSGPWPVGIGPQNTERDERLSDLLVEKNKIIADYGEQHYQVNTGIQVSGRYATIRNNIVDGTGGRADFFGISVFRRGIEWTPFGNSVYNNTVYSQDNHTSEAIGLFVHADANDTIVRNNYVSLPNTASPSLLTDNSGNAISSNNVLTNTPYFTDANNPNSFLRDFSLRSAATEAIDQGITVPVLDDFTGQIRSGVYDVGAYEYQQVTSTRADVDGSSAITTTDALLTLRNSLGLSMTGTAWQVSATTGDVNCDGVSNSTDALLILRHSLGLSMSGTGWCEGN